MVESKCCTQCKQVRKSNQFTKCTKSVDGLLRSCKLCAAEKVRLRKVAAVQFLGGECMDCGLRSDISTIYDFHHRNPSEKEFVISTRRKYRWEIMAKELVKCDLLCVNCHRTRHAYLDNDLGLEVASN